MMKNYTILLLLLFTIVSCNKKVNIQRDIEIPAVIEFQYFSFAADRILQKSQKDFNLAVRFITFGTYKGDESFSLTINGIEAKKSKLPISIGDVGTTLLFDVAAIEKAGDYKAIFTYKIGESSFTTEKTIRVVEDFSLPKIWDKFDVPYTKEHPIFLYISSNRNVLINSQRQIILSNNTVNGTQQGIGEYRSVFTNTPNPFQSNPLIAGLDGEYYVYYKDNKIEQIRVIFQEVYDNPRLDINDILKQMKNIYGAEVGFTGSRLFRSGAFDIQIRDESFGFTQAIVRKVR